MNNTTKIISFEGLPGVGKTSTIKNVKYQLQSHGLRCISTNDLFRLKSDRIGDKIIDLMKSGNDPFMRLDNTYGNAYIEALLSQAIRYNIVNKELRVTDEYDIILEDRGIDTYYSYILTQIHAQFGKDYSEIIEWLNSLNQYCEIEYLCTFLLIDSISECRKRYDKRNEQELMDDDWLFLERVGESYNYLMQKNKRIIPINVNNEKQANISQEITGLILQIMEDA